MGFFVKLHRNQIEVMKNTANKIDDIVHIYHSKAITK